MFEVTPKALAQLDKVLRGEKKEAWGIRLFVEGMPHEEKECWILFEDKPRSCDRLYLKGKLTFVVGPESAYFLKAKALDWDESSEEFWVEPSVGEAWDDEEWEYLDALPPEEPDWGSLEGEWVEEDEEDAKPAAPRERAHKAVFRLPRGWRPAP